jgi:ABC-type sugar transport system ATPase subunit
VYNLPANRFVATTIGSPPTNFITADVRPHGDNLLMAHAAFALAAEGARHPVRAALESGAAGGLQPLPEKVLIGFRPEDVRVATSQSSGCSVPAQVSVVEPLGGETVVDLHLGGDPIKAVVPPTQRLEERRHVWLNIDPDRIHLFDARTGLRIYTTGQAETFACLEAVH